MSTWQILLAMVAMVAAVAFNMGMDDELDRQSALRNHIEMMNFERNK